MGDSVSNSKESFRSAWDSKAEQSDDDEDSEFDSEQTVGEEKYSNSFTHIQEQSYEVDKNIDMCSALADMYLNNSELNNVTISVKGSNDDHNTFSAHSLVLAMWSNYFYNKFYSESKKIPGFIEIDNMDPKVFEWVLCFMYDVVKPLENTRKALEIYKVAERLEVKYIKETVIEYVCLQTPTVSDVVDILKASLYMNLSDRKEICLKFIKDNTYKIFDVGFSNFSVDIMKEIIQLDTLCLKSEYELVKNVFRWVKMHSKLNMMDCRDALEEFLPNLYLLNLNAVEFTKILGEFEDFFVGDEALSILMNIVIFKSKDLPEWLMVKKRNFTQIVNIPF